MIGILWAACDNELPGRETQGVLPPPPPAPSPAAQPGWYGDPWQVAPWRWWDGHNWTAHVGGQPPTPVVPSPPPVAPYEPDAGLPVQPTEKKPRLPTWLSAPVAGAAVPVIPWVGYTAVTTPIAVILGLVPLLIVLPVLSWLDRVEPEPRSSRIHAVLWGALVAGLISVIINTGVAVAAGEQVAAVVSAPLFEEGSKALGLLWAVRRKELDGVVDGLVYAGWIGLGFAVIEDFTYFTYASEEGLLLPTFVMRALLTPFAHPLFTAWTGLAVGMAVSKGKKILPYSLWGLVLAVLSHAAWNGSMVASQATGNPLIAVVVILLFIVFFFATGVTVTKLRGKEERAFEAAVPFLAERYQLPADDVRVFGDWRTMLATRKALPRGQRGDFDKVHASLARLAVLHRRPDPTDTTSEQILAAQLHKARGIT